MNRLSVIVTTLNAINQIGLLFDSLARQENKQFDVIIVDANSTDGTIDFIRTSKLQVTLIISPGASIYEGINIGIQASKNEYYLVCGSDDILFPEAVGIILNDISAGTDNDLLLYAVKKDEIVCKPYKPTPWKKTMGWQSIVASHSVGSVIRKNLHYEFGFYSPKYNILADGYFFSKVLQTDRNIFISNDMIGSFSVKGISSRNLYRNIFATFLIQIEARSFFPQLLLLIYRLAKHRKTVLHPVE